MKIQNSEMEVFQLTGESPNQEAILYERGYPGQLYSMWYENDVAKEYIEINGKKFEFAHSM